MAKRAIMLIGPPGCGKSTWVNYYLENGGDAVLISTDNFIDMVAKQKGLTYNDVFDQTIKAATAAMEFALTEAITRNDSILWDQTNLTVKSRKPKLEKLFKAGYEVCAIAFEVDARILNDRRLGRPGKTIPPHVLRSMDENYERPTLNEGFTDVIIRD